ncbi:hypothetical protein DM02DRAFT_652347 [Periconia macrospinosa]|uniref:Uncharacterized protein n=1 Tax=Periconia macrospinosa TaxID=97972 RepID=A0A2V1E0C2_9PLEO|nr:hypothetical protein DM02DRAFT_652347 [Periconia macrospinosa]
MSTNLQFFKGPAKDARAWTIKKLTEPGHCHSENITSNLDNAIHPIFGFERFKNVDQTLYRKMEPALRLATIFLTEDALVDWFYHNTVGVFKVGKKDGEEETDTRASTSEEGLPEDGLPEEGLPEEGLPEEYKRPYSSKVNTFSGKKGLKPYLAPNPDLDYKDPTGRRAVRELWLKKLTDLSQLLKIYMLESGKEVKGLDGRAYGFVEDLEREMQDLKQLEEHVRLWRNEDGSLESAEAHWPYEGNEETQPAILIGNCFRPLFEAMPADIANASSSQQQEYINCCFHLARVVVHEVAHVVGLFPRIRFLNTRSALSCEVYSSYNEHLEGSPEFGYSWEETFLGHRAPTPMRKINQDTDAIEAVYSGLILPTIIQDLSIFGGDLDDLSSAKVLQMFSADHFSQYFRKESCALACRGQFTGNTVAVTVLTRIKDDHGNWHVTNKIGDLDAEVEPSMTDYFEDHMFTSNVTNFVCLEWLWYT